MQQVRIRDTSGAVDSLKYKECEGRCQQKQKFNDLYFDFVYWQKYPKLKEIPSRYMLL